jgi:hypothetical protein
LKPKPLQRIDELSWKEIEAVVDLLAAQLPKPCYLWGVPRNGLLVATLLSHSPKSEGKFSLRYQVRPLQNVFTLLTVLLIASEVPLIVVDDIADSGDTLTQLLHKLGHTPETELSTLETAVLFKCSACLFQPTYVGKEKTSDAWLRFPWERDPLDILPEEGATPSNIVLT